jgi:arylsulfatase A-like enzyme
MNDKKLNRSIKLVAVFCILCLNISSPLLSYANEFKEPLKEKKQPNIIVILADDMGFGDIGAYNKESAIPTNHLDQLANEGIRFTNAHTPSSVCTPTRYSVLTGRYAWRSKLKSGVLWGYSPLLIETDRATIPSMLKEKGYHTAGIGKWHLGLGDSEADYYLENDGKGQNSGDDFGRLSPGPNEVGFDYFFGIPASLDMKPYVYIENGKPYRPLDGQLIKSSKQRRIGGEGFWRKGQIAEGFVHKNVLPTITDKAKSYIESRSKAQDDKPFFLYFALTAPHTPWLPTDEFIGKSKAGYYGDFAVQVDDVVGQIRATLKKTGMDENTLLVFTSDNGAHWTENDLKKYNHLANGSFRGQKADIYEGGHRVPLIVTWPDNIPQNISTDQPTTLTDLMATFAAIVDVKLEDDEGPDSFNILPTLLNQHNLQKTRAPMIHHSYDGMFAIRDGDWKLVDGLGSGGFTKPVRDIAAKGESSIQLYNLKDDPNESKNIANLHPELVKKLLGQLNSIKETGASR